MLINTKERIETLLEAEVEFRGASRTTPQEDFHRDKIARAWERARSSAAYAHLGAFSWEAFTALPVTPKERLKEDPWCFVAVPLGTCAKYYETTGTTGGATPTPRLAEDIIWNTASVASAWRDVLTDHDRVLSLLPSDIVPVGDLVSSVCDYLDLPHTRAYPFATGISDWDRLIDLWTTLRPTTVFLAPGVALQLTRLLQQRGFLGDVSRSVRSLMLLGEVSVPAMRRRLGQWWEASVYDASYGSTETGTLAATCREDHLHLLTSANYIELDQGDRTVPLTAASGTGDLVVTPLNLHARPLLRYATGDRAEVSDGCACGGAAPVVRILGRGTDGLRVHGVALTPGVVEEVVYGATTATGYLLETDSHGKTARLLLERGVGTDRSLEGRMAEELQRRSREHLGTEWDEVTFVNTLPANTKSGGSQKSWKRSNIRIVETS
ncbi:hypothetical protein RIF23_14580 [Lipingzhangella sp. LS1_29]|uniref:Phenylacetate-CoA ligase n=1 Tax=Lipingzhangella rawalii TaxID=2055835 RepID=A0ABU2H887_9ACTN|nr:hypothetical protein [Lipingzhangella rawalii]MDS1271522.1 hypothetical protein [Lipingzhangella rawalii]